MTLPPNPPCVRTLHTAETERLRRIYTDLPVLIENCITCHGQKFFRWKYEDDDLIDNAVAWECNCDEQFVLHRWLLHAGIDLHYQRLSWADMAGTDPGAEELLLDYGGHASQYAACGLGLLLYGNRGTGKTLVATLLMKMLLADGYDGYFTTFHNLIDIFTTSWRDNEEKGWFDRRIRNAGILVIDDIGREYKGRVEMVESLLDHVVRARVAAERPTIITTNKNLAELQTLYQSNVISLLAESSMHYHFQGEDFRPNFQERKIAEARAGLTRPVVLG